MLRLAVTIDDFLTLLCSNVSKYSRSWPSVYVLVRPESPNLIRILLGSLAGIPNLEITLVCF